MDFISEVRVREMGFNEPANALGTARNLSLAGILFAVDKPFDINRKVEVSFTLGSLEACFSAVGTVVRVEYFQNQGYEIGVSFMEEDRQNLNFFFSQMKFNQNNASLNIR